MGNQHKTIDELTSEVAALHQKVAELEAALAHSRRSADSPSHSPHLKIFSTDNLELGSPQAWLEDILNFLPSPLLFIEPGSGKVLFANRAADEIAGGEFPKGKPAEEYHTIYYCTDANGDRIPDSQMPGVRVARGEQLHGFDMDWHTPAGMRSLIVFGKTLPAMHGYPEIGVVMFQDISDRKRAEQAQRHSEARLKCLFEANLIGIFSADLDGTVMEANDRFLNMIGYSREELLAGKIRWNSITPPEFAEHDQQAVLELMEQKVCSPYEKEFICKNDRRIPVLVGTALFEDSQTLGATFVIDLSQQKRIEQALRHSNDRLESLVEERTSELMRTNRLLREEIAERQRAEQSLQTEREFLKILLDNLQAGIVACNADGVLTLFNQAAREFHGLPEQPLPPDQWAAHYDLYLPDGKTLMQPEDIPLFQALQGKPVHNVEMMIVPKNGQAKTLLSSGQAIVHPNGTKQGAVVIMHDITDRKQMEQEREQLIREQAAHAELEASRAELQRIFLQAPAVIQITHGLDHVTHIVNSVYTRLIGDRDVVGKPMREAFPELESQGFFELLDQVYTTGRPFIGNEMRVEFDRNNDGVIEESFWNFIYQPLFNADNQVYGIMTHAVEVTEQVRARKEIEQKAEELTQLTQALQRSNQELDQFAYVTSHDLKAPLRGIASLSEWIEEDLAEYISEESRQHLNLMRGRVHRMEALIEGILQYSRAGRTQTIERVDVQVLLSEVVELLSPPPTVRVEIGDKMPIFRTERVPLQQVFLNLINNAINHGGKPDIQIQVRVKESKHFYEFSVSDDGQGIEPKFHERIWAIFQRLESRDKVEGTGIGLAVIKKIVESRGGQIWISSTFGQGATFTFCWPKTPSKSKGR